MITFLREL